MISNRSLFNISISIDDWYHCCYSDIVLLFSIHCCWSMLLFIVIDPGRWVPHLFILILSFLVRLFVRLWSICSLMLFIRSLHSICSFIHSICPTSFVDFICIHLLFIHCCCSNLFCCSGDHSISRCWYSDLHLLMIVVVDSCWCCELTR